MNHKPKLSFRKEKGNPNSGFWYSAGEVMSALGLVLVTFGVMWGIPTNFGRIALDLILTGFGCYATLFVTLLIQSRLNHRKTRRWLSLGDEYLQESGSW